MLEVFYTSLEYDIIFYLKFPPKCLLTLESIYFSSRCKMDCFDNRHITFEFSSLPASHFRKKLVNSDQPTDVLLMFVELSSVSVFEEYVVQDSKINRRDASCFVISVTWVSEAL